MKFIAWDKTSQPDASSINKGLTQMGYMVLAKPLAHLHTSAPNTVEKEDILWVAKGEIEVKTNNESRKMKVGDKLILQAGERYHTVSLSPEGSYYFFCKKMKD